MKTKSLVLSLIVSLTVLGETYGSFVTIRVLPVLAPNGVFPQSSFDAFNANAQQALSSSDPTTPVGSPGLPSYFQVLPDGAVVSPSNLVVTDFPSWLGQANPGGALASEYGTRLHFAVQITQTDPGNPLNFSIAQLGFFATGDPDDILNLPPSFAPPGSFTYTDYYVGVQGNSTVKSPPNTTGVTGLYSLGVGNAYEALAIDPGATLQDKIDDTVAGIAPFTYVGTYYLDLNNNGQFDPGVDAVGSASVTIGTPEPASITIALIGLVGGWVVYRHGRRMQDRRAIPPVPNLDAIA